VKRTTLLASLLMVCSWTRGAQLDCPPGPCVIDVAVLDEAHCTMSVSADPIMFHKPGAMLFRLQTAGWRFAPGTEIKFKEPPAGRVVPAGLFTPIVSQSSHTFVAVHNRYDIARPLPGDVGAFPYTINVVKEDGSKACQLDPVVANN
jgi:hypothetical protein